MKVVVIENDGIQADKIKSYLEVEGHWCDVQYSPSEALTAITALYYDAIVFNLSLLAPDEMELLRYLRNARIDKKAILTFEQNGLINQNKVDALGMANLAKPYTLPNLYEKISTVLHYEHLDNNQTLFFNEIRIDIPGRTVRVKDQLVPVTRREFDLLLYLAAHKTQVVSKITLAQYLSKNKSAEQENIHDFGSLYAHMKNLKKKLKAAGANDYIRTLYGIGYRFEPM